MPKKFNYYQWQRLNFEKKILKEIDTRDASQSLSKR